MTMIIQRFPNWRRASAVAAHPGIAFFWRWHRFSSLPSLSPSIHLSTVAIPTRPWGKEGSRADLNKAMDRWMFGKMLQQLAECWAPAHNSTVLFSCLTIGTHLVCPTDNTIMDFNTIMTTVPFRLQWGVYFLRACVLYVKGLCESGVWGGADLSFMLKVR